MMVMVCGVVGDDGDLDESKGQGRDDKDDHDLGAEIFYD